MKKKERRKRQLSQQLYIRKERGATFVGFRPITFASKKHPSRAKRKAMEESYNNLLENIHVMDNKSNYDWLMESKKQLEAGKAKKRDLIEVTDE